MLEKLARPVDSFFNRIDIDRPVWRVNWSLTTDPTLFQPVRQKNIMPKSPLHLKTPVRKFILDVNVKHCAVCQIPGGYCLPLKRILIRFQN